MLHIFRANAHGFTHTQIYINMRTRVSKFGLSKIKKIEFSLLIYFINELALKKMLQPIKKKLILSCIFGIGACKKLTDPRTKFQFGAPPYTTQLFVVIGQKWRWSVYLACPKFPRRFPPPPFHTALYVKFWFTIEINGHTERFFVIS